MWNLFNMQKLQLKTDVSTSFCSLPFHPGNLVHFFFSLLLSEELHSLRCFLALPQALILAPALLTYTLLWWTDASALGALLLVHGSGSCT